MLPKPKRLTATLPPTPSTPELRAKIVAIAQQHGVSIAYIQRLAFIHFLTTYDKEVIGSEHQAPGTGVETPPSVPAPHA